MILVEILKETQKYSELNNKVGEIRSAINTENEKKEKKQRK